MAHKRIFWQIFPAYMVVAVLSILTVLFFSTKEIEKQNLLQMQKDLEAMARLVADRVSIAEESRIDAYCDKLGSKIGRRITVVSSTGRVLGDSEKKPSSMDNHIDRKEIQVALKGEVGINIRFSDTLKQKMLYVAVPVVDEDGHVSAVARVSVSNEFINEIIGSVVDGIIGVGLLTAIAAAVVSILISRRISEPLVVLRQGAEQFKTGDLKHRLSVEGCYETATLAHTMNNMANELDNKINDIINQRTRQKAILSSMTEAVVAVDNTKTLIMANGAARELFDIPDDSIGRVLEQVARNPELHQVVDTMLKHRSSILDEEITIFKNNQPAILQVHATVLSSETEDIGVLVVLNNVTQLKKLENVRKEFVANVSHELKTPITSIKGFVETLRDGAINDSQNAVKFLDIIARQTNRLESIIEDLLALSRIEQLEDVKQVELEKQTVKPVLSAAISVCQKKAKDRSVNIHCDCNEAVEARINRNLLEQAVVNLVDNAVKYSDKEQDVLVSAVTEDDAVVIKVKDHGCGIPEEEFARLFERFYRVDKARSRELGGTGLGLSIVKHIVKAHKGSVTVKSKPGEGSEFCINLPL